MFPFKATLDSSDSVQAQIFETSRSAHLHDQGKGTIFVPLALYVALSAMVSLFELPRHLVGSGAEGADGSLVRGHRV